MSNKIKIGFEITDTWNRAEFRELIRFILYNPATVCGQEDVGLELYLISSDSSAYIARVAAIINSWYPDNVILDSNHIVVCNFRQDKVNACTNNNINVYFDADGLTVTMVDATDTHGVLVRTEMDRYNVKQKYITDFQNILKEIIREQSN